MALLTKNKNYINSIDQKLYEYLSPELVLVQLKKNYNLMVKTNDQVLKNQVLFQKDHLSIFSPVSGVIDGAKKAVTSNGNIVDCVQIRNDYKEKVKEKKGARKNLNHITKEELLKNLINHSIPNMYHNSYLFEQFFSYSQAKNLIVSGVDLEMSFFADSFVMKTYSNEILETIDALIEILKIEKCYLVFRNNDNENITNYSEYLGTYPKIKIKLVSPKYPNGLDHILRRELFPNYPNDKEILFLGCQNIMAIYESLKRNRTINEKYITITGPMIENPKVIKVKIGSYIKPIINELIKLKTKDNIVYYANGEITGIEVDINNLFISPSTTGVYITSKNESSPSECLNCGKCLEKCPVGINPKYIMDNIEKSEKISNSHIEKCLNCGLCSHICPSNINLKEYLKRANYEK